MAAVSDAGHIRIGNRKLPAGTAVSIDAAVRAARDSARPDLAAIRLSAEFASAIELAKALVAATGLSRALGERA
jgi:hypothetical protein